MISAARSEAEGTYNYDTAGGNQTLGGLDGTSGYANNNSNAHAWTLTINQTSGTYTFGGIIEDTNGFALNLIKSGAGTWVLNGTNTYIGTTAVNGGILVLDETSGADHALGTGGHTLTINNGAIVRYGAAEQLDNLTPIVINGSTMDMQTFHDATAGGGLTLNGGSIIGTTGSGLGIPAGTITSTGASVISTATLALSGANQSIVVSNGTLTLNTAVTAGTFTLSGTGTMVLSGANSFIQAGGYNIVSSGSTLQSGALNNMGTAGINVNAGGLWNLAGFAESVSGLGGTGGGGTVNLNGGTLSMTGAGGTFGPGGIITGNGSLVISTTANTQVLASADNFVGSVVLGGGTVNIQNATAFGNTANTVSATNTLLQVQGGIAIGANPLSIGSGTVVESVSGANSLAGLATLNSSTTVNVDTSTLTLGGGLAGTGDLTKIGSGSLALGGLGAWAGNTNINAGLILLGATNALSSTGTVTISNGSTLNTQTNSSNIAALSLLSGSVLGTGTLTASGTSANTFDIRTGTINANLAGASAGLTKSTTGMVVMTGASTYGGGTTMSNGVMVLSNTAGSALGSGGLALNGGTLMGIGSIAGDVTGGGNNHAINPGGAGAIGNLTVGSLYLNGNSTLNFTVSGSPSGLDKIIATGSLNVPNSADTVNVVVPGLGLLVGGTYVLVDYTTPSALTDASNFSIAGGAPQGYSLVLDTSANDLDLVFTPNTWQGAGGSNWNNVANWTLGSVPNAHSAVAYFSAGAGGGSPVVIDSSFAPRVGTMVFSGSASYDIQAADPATSRLYLDNRTNGINSTITLTADSAAQMISAPISIVYDNVTITNSSPNALTLSGPISGGGFTLNLAAGLLVLSNSGNSNFATVINAGSTLQLGGDNSLPGAVTVAGGLLDLQSHSTTAGSLLLQAGTVTSSGGILSAGSIELQNGLVAAGLGGSSGFSKTTSATVVVTGNSTVSGAVAINAGILNVQSSGGLGDEGNTVTITSGAALQIQGGYTFSQTLNVAGSGPAGAGALENIGGNNIWAGPITISSTIGVDAQSLNVTGIITGADLTKVGGGTLILSNSGNAYGNTNINGGVVQLGGANVLPATGTVTVNNNTTLDTQGFSSNLGGLTLVSGSVIGSGTLTAGGTAANTFNVQSGEIDANLTGVSAGLTKSGTGLVILTGTNTYGGATTVANGTLRAFSGVGLPAASPLYVTGGVLETNGSILQSLSGGTFQWTGGGFAAKGAPADHQHR